MKQMKESHNGRVLICLALAVASQKRKWTSKHLQC
jgi:hypothetical protein